ncbi:hypothetical protein RSSM_06098 [Rhodopirellula sallentina SM41]|uniref:Carboxypeptidase regulatory-like domain-containing protein n=2 Tax=Rhodopirellula TaxID=265488 RepID=M5TTI7_9BACT|nr:hypothetical protein RSSM_06098 [Rhodopirellula sallentina SM41]
MTGVVTKDGEPLGSVMVFFMPDPEKGNDGSMSRATTDSEGRYSLVFTGDGSTPGAVVGWHCVTVEDIASENFRGAGRPPEPRVGGVYMDPSHTPLKVEVVDGEQTIDLEVVGK